MAILQRQFQELQTYAQENQVTSDRVAELEVEAELQEMVAWGGKM